MISIVKEFTVALNPENKLVSECVTDKIQMVLEASGGGGGHRNLGCFVGVGAPLLPCRAFLLMPTLSDASFMVDHVVLL